ncbi:hypothetical protein ACHAXR_000434, partial [Thalassiosira sp. AJA248-18]
KSVTFGSICCCKGTVDGITDFHLPQELEFLYTSGDEVAMDFRNNARTYNNGMAMCSLTAKNGWRTRTPNNKMDSVLRQMISYSGALSWHTDRRRFQQIFVSFCLPPHKTMVTAHSSPIFQVRQKYPTIYTKFGYCEDLLLLIHNDVLNIYAAHTWADIQAFLVCYRVVGQIWPMSAQESRIGTIASLNGC